MNITMQYLMKESVASRRHNKADSEEMLSTNLGHVRA